MNRITRINNKYNLPSKFDDIIQKYLLQLDINYNMCFDGPW